MTAYIHDYEATFEKLSSAALKAMAVRRVKEYELRPLQHFAEYLHLYHEWLAGVQAWKNTSFVKEQRAAQRRSDKALKGLQALAEQVELYPAWLAVRKAEESGNVERIEKARLRLGKVRTKQELEAAKRQALLEPQP